MSAGRAPWARHLPVTPARVGARLRDLARPPRGAFPWTAPSWPSTVPRPSPRARLGAAYENEWARRYPARATRLLLNELVVRPALAAVARPDVVGADRLGHLDEPLIFAANHSSHLDTPLLVSVLPERWRHRTVVAGAADYFFDTRAKAVFLSLAVNAIPIERTRVNRDSANRAAALLREGWSLVIYPEGGRSPDGWAQPHRAGAAWLAVRTGRPIVPVHLAGTRDILPRSSNRLHPGPTRVSFGRPIRPEPGGDPRQLATRVEAAVSALADEAATDWWSATRRAAQDRTPSLTGPDAGGWRRSWALGAPRANRATGRPDRWPRL